MTKIIMAALALAASIAFVPDLMAQSTKTDKGGAAPAKKHTAKRTTIPQCGPFQKPPCEGPRTPLGR